MRQGAALLSAAIMLASAGAITGAAFARQPTATPAEGAAPTAGLAAPRTPGGISAGAVQGNQTRMNATVGSINDRLLQQEKDRPRLPGQAPSPSQTLPGGTASGRTPH